MSFWQSSEAVFTTKWRPSADKLLVLGTLKTTDSEFRYYVVESGSCTGCPRFWRRAGNCKCLKRLVDLNGFEPLTSSMPWKRAPNCATGPLREAISWYHSK